MLKITDYQAAFRPGDNTFFITVRDENQHFSTITVKSAEAFNAMLIILGRKDVVYDPIAKAFELQMRPVGT